MTITASHLALLVAVATATYALTDKLARKAVDAIPGVLLALALLPAIAFERGLRLLVFHENRVLGGRRRTRTAEWWWGRAHYMIHVLTERERFEYGMAWRLTPTYMRFRYGRVVLEIFPLLQQATRESKWARRVGTDRVGNDEYETPGWQEGLDGYDVVAERARRRLVRS